MPVKVAIIGAGVGGLTLAVALQHNPNLEVSVYERATELKEIGALVGLAPNGLRTLEKLGVTEALTDEVGWRSPSGIPMIFLHWQTGERLSEDIYHNVPDRRHHFARMHRAQLQKALLKHVPPESIHLAKKAVSLEVNRSTGSTITFADGTSTHADVVVGADGIKSNIRKAFVPDHELMWAGDLVLRCTFDYSLVQDIKGLPQDSSHFAGPDSWFFGTRIGADQFGVTAGLSVDPENDPEFREPVWNAPAEVKTLRERYVHWHPVVGQIIDRVPWVRRYCNVAGRALDHWSFNDRVTLLGDAAHTHGGAFAAGVSLAIDDAFALALAFDEIYPPALAPAIGVASPKLIGQVFDLYETTRKPHAAKVLAHVHEGRSKARARLDKRRHGTPESDADFRTRMANRGDPVWVNEYDVEAAFRQVVITKTGAQLESNAVPQIPGQARL